ncbi:hypothetical protein V9T40_013988 [Parthenolecanium corni]|uniref:Major facilitator superfamily (MFS) profile domain-containing protein n=1 Tax=Parthenolecanium corni TaxID=536013 RepID=A0AAN9TEC3_9HEMI
MLYVLTEISIIFKMVSPVAEFSPLRWLRFMSVEPAMFLSMVACTMLDFGNVNIYLQKACRTNTTTKPDFSISYDDNKEKGIIFVANVNTYIRSATMFLVLLSVALYASWSDKAGGKHKFFLMITLVGQVLESILLFLHSYYWSLPPMFAAITAAVVHVLFGHPHSSMSAFGFMYLCEVVDLQSRTMRLGIFTSVKVLGMLVGKGTSGFLLHYIGFCRYYAVCLGISLAAVIYGYFFINDISIPQENKVSLRSVFNVRHLIESFEIIFGKRMQHGIYTIILILTFTLLLFIHEGNEILYFKI